MTNVGQASKKPLLMTPFLKGLITVVKEVGHFTPPLSHPPQKLVRDGFTDKGNTMSTILGDVSGWYFMFP